MDDRTSIGENIKRFRGKLFSQRALADRAGVSVEIVRKLEQGARHTASIPTLQAIARVLDVTVAELLGDRPGGMPSVAPEGGAVAIGRALRGGLVDDLLGEEDPQGTPQALTEAEHAIDYLWAAYWRGDYTTLLKLIPAALIRARATYRNASESDRPRAAHALARTYQIAGDSLVQLGHLDGAWLGAREAIGSAADSDDELLDAALRVSVAWQLMVQGQFDEAERIAVSAAQHIEPHGEVSDSHLAAYGVLIDRAATAAARAQRPSTAVDLLAESTAIAGRLGYERSDHQTHYGPAKTVTTAVDVALVAEDYSGALKAARELPRDAALPTATRARFLADVALAQMRLGRSEAAFQALLAAESLSPDWMRFQQFPRQVARELVTRENRLRTPLRDFAQRVGVGGDQEAYVPNSNGW
ncbi:helix-turn-helix domain-containing protein [Actinokineospora spheciospongiae]|uniref:helix-turn-helix domain-containing protein n=1 Tax=Actinokineospora spheciospongiae TaxID=909613 RepID=UPI000D712C76|nr:helix-turn-helix transcriptional regulator [Actinokineospora spheciospongiae]PWW62719.1 helix-turn-helix protein [Actinokineospora spheciospongiae]